MPAFIPVLYALGGIALRATTKKIAETLAKKGARKITESAAKKLGTPKNVTQGNVGNVLKNATKKPSAQPRNPTNGRVQGNKPTPAARRTTDPKIVRDKPNQPAAPKKDGAPTVRTSSGRPAANATSPKQGSSGASYSRTGSNAPKAKNDSKIVGVSPMGRAALGSASLADGLPEVDTSSRPTKKAPKRTAPSSMKTPKKVEKKKVEKKKTAPKGPMSLREYLNAEIKKRDSSVTDEKKGSDKYRSIAAAKKAGSLYYKNKNGKTMAAVYKEDLKK